MAEKIVRPIDDVRADKRLNNVRSLKPHREEKGFSTSLGSYKEQFVEIWEVRDKKTGQVFLLTDDLETKEDNKKHTLLQGPDFFLQSRGKFAWNPLVFNEDDERAWGVPDSKILEPYLLEINEIKTQQMFHRRITIHVNNR